MKLAQMKDRMQFLRGWQVIIATAPMERGSWQIEIHGQGVDVKGFAILETSRAAEARRFKTLDAAYRCVRDELDYRGQVLLMP